MSLVDIVVLGLAVWRLSSFLVNEQGPNGICAKFRQKCGLTFDVETGQDIPQNWFANELTCQWCFGLFVGLFFSLLYFIYKPLAFCVALPFALSTINILIMTSKGVQVYLRHLKDD